MHSDGTCPWNVDSGDVDKDGVTEMVTVGCMFTGIKCSGHLRIWSIQRSSTFPLYGLYVIVATVATVLAFAGAYPYLRKKPKTTQTDPFEDEPNVLVRSLKPSSNALDQHVFCPKWKD